MFHFILILLCSNIFSPVESTERSLLKSPRRKSFASLVFLNRQNSAPQTSCQWIKRLKHQSKICWKEQGVDEVLQNAKSISIWQCETQFKFDQWNCSSRSFYFKNFYKETAFMYSLVSSAVLYSTVRACSEKTLPDCKCGEPTKTQSNSTKWQWGGCNENAKFAKKFTRRFFQLKKKSDGFNGLAKYNTEIGIRTVLEAYENSRVCKCHGVSGSCFFKVCYKAVPKFELIVQKLKNLYYRAEQIQAGNRVKNFKSFKKKHVLLYLEKSPNFCTTTTGRECLDTENCATLCCAKNPYMVQTIFKNTTCHCSLNQKTFKTDCVACFQKKNVFKCP